MDRPHPPELSGLVIVLHGRTGGPGAATQERRLRLVCDHVEVVDAGSALAGLVEGLEGAPTALVAATTADLPEVDPELLRRLAAAWRGEAAVVQLLAERVRAFPGVYAASWAAPLREQMASGRRGVIPAISALTARVVGPEVWGEVAELDVGTARRAGRRGRRSPDRD